MVRETDSHGLRGGSMGRVGSTGGAPALGPSGGFSSGFGSVEDPPNGSASNVDRAPQPPRLMNAEHASNAMAAGRTRYGPTLRAIARRDG